ncbi:glutathione S-transferase family protein [Duganella sp. Root1480D1]|uniref:glutathione S-transferase family protein n=1 Tax=Duganella sp. Root1480D1 TaxID=1736471 RepID=UPI00070B1C39|nr:glutathione S-transferase [Duganella sp. Root1480D1]KQZ32685.1 glutathione S-transferase [Duganella sp. Root1480D1]
MKLYYHPISGHAHRAHLFLSLLGLDFELVEVDLMKSEQKTEAFLQLNPFGQVPVLEDDGVVIADSNAILVYLATRYGNANWLPQDPVGAAGVQRWLSVAAGEIASGPATARIIKLFKKPIDPADAIARAHRILGLVEGSLAGKEWIAAGWPTIADIALYSYIARAPEGNVDLADYANVKAWLARVENLPRFQPFIKSPVGLAA